MLSIVIPVFNGDSVILRQIERIRQVLTGFDDEWELILVDDGSTDMSLNIIRKAAEKDQHIGWISLARNAGQQLAVLCGLRHSRGDWIITMDDDPGHPAELILRLYEEARKGFDAVYAVPLRVRRRGGLMRDLFFRLFLNKPAGLRIGSFRIFSRAAAERISEARQPFVYVSAELFRAGMRVSSIEYKEDENPESSVPAPAGAGPSRYTFASRLGLYLRLMRWYGPFSCRREGEQYIAADRGGCL